jgi:Baseplate J-like protein
MPIRPPALDDRSFADLVDEVLARIPAHSPEYTNPRIGDPGRTLIELFAWLTDAMLYRANLVPERQRLAFLRLLGANMQPAVAARGLIGLAIDDDSPTALTMAALARIEKPVPFETRREVTVVPVSAEGFCKRPLSDDEKKLLAPMSQRLAELYGLSGSPLLYVTTPVFPGGAAMPAGVDLVKDTVDGSLWLALLAPKKEQIAQARTALGKDPNGGQVLLSVGVMPNIAMPEPLATDIGPRGRIPHIWEVSTGKLVDGKPEYVTCDVIEDSSAGLTRRGVLRIQLAAESRLGALPNDVRQDVKAGTDDRPPRLDDPDQAERLVCWLRLRPDKGVTRLALSWVGINAVEIDQRSTVTGRVVAQSNGRPGQEVQLPGLSVEKESLVLQVEEPGRGYQQWAQADDLMFAGGGDSVFSLDAEAGVVRFGDGIHGRIPPVEQRIRVGLMRAGGGRAGNLAPGSFENISGTDLAGARIERKLKVLQALPTDGGQDAEDLGTAELRIPQLLRNRDRAITALDFQVLAAQAPGVSVGRVEVMPGFKPQQRRSGVPGVVSVLVLPWADLGPAPNPRPDRPFLEAVHGQLDDRRPLSTELYTIGAEYLALGVSAGITIKDGFGRDQTLTNVRLALRRFFWPLPGGGPDGGGWPLKRAVRDREIEVVIAQVPGVQAVLGVNVFKQGKTDWSKVQRVGPQYQAQYEMLDWQLPELLSVVVIADELPPEDLRGVPNPFAKPGVAVPVVPEVC